MVFRVFFGHAGAGGARSWSGGHLAHGEHANPATGEAEDTDVGFPGPEHHIAEREWPMKAAMAPAGRCWRSIAGRRWASRA